MKIITKILLTSITVLWAMSGYAQPLKVILDTDIDSDVDDVGALAMLHTLADHGAVDILGIIVTSGERHAPLCADAINHYFDRPDIPIGVQKGIELREFSKYTKKISEEYEHSLPSYEKAEDATRLYRKLLSSQADSSVVIITIGHLSNLRNLIESEPGEYSDLSGTALIKRKVKFWSAMGGEFPEGKEANFYRPDPASTKKAVEQWPVDVIFSGYEIGNEIITGADFLEKMLSDESPVWRAYQLFNNFEGRQSWDQSAVLYAVSPFKNEYWEVNREGYVKVNEDGSNTWVPGRKSNHAHLVEKMDPDEIAKIIDALMTGIYSSKF
ncbi:Inosine-uridine nucleoside N-ribohydrolase [Fodinibius roseus]|uniref:Inosine-uridine nucleoside N-ribohydrolase n=1 Tax=Fodinibius roseus TaxID=1194090 RepID=A0A1M5HJH7_9BACT|nr:nucleoside hydrolase [Fodinibius roseus]SHG16058.1 Inosine-uridine nucleoside N-ribohydrolase [Fodinibius roseus]